MELAEDQLQPAASPSGEGVRAHRRFDFNSDTFAFANELIWEYQFDTATGKTTFRRREPKPHYAHRCFVLTRAARQFLYHARFDAARPIADDETYRRLIREVVSRNPRTPCPLEKQIVIPGFASLREFSAAREPLLKAGCGGAWRSYVLRSHWRMIFPISRAHQEQTAARLLPALGRDFSPIVHLVRFPSLTINHGMILFDTAETATGVVFSAYDPNDPVRPAQLTFDRATRTFSLPQNRYWAGGKLNVIEIYRGWFM
jgi:hypothetical protein